MTNFLNSVAIVTGGAEGIGKALVSKMAEMGARVVIADINADKAQALARSLENAAGTVICRELDVTDESAFTQLIDNTVSEFGKLDYLFNNAGIAVTGDARDLTLEQWQRVTAVNQWGVIYGSMAAYKIMAQQGYGHIVNIASLAGLIPFPTNLPYSATKFAVVGSSMSLRAEGEDLGVKVSVVCPGFIRSHIFEASEMVNVPRDKMIANIAFNLVETDVAAAKILSGVSKNKAIIVFPAYAKIFWWLHRISPALLKPLALKLIRDLRKVRVTSKET